MKIILLLFALAVSLALPAQSGDAEQHYGRIRKKAEETATYPEMVAYLNERIDSLEATNGQHTTSVLARVHRLTGWLYHERPEIRDMELAFFHYDRSNQLSERTTDHTRLRKVKGYKDAGLTLDELNLNQASLKPYEQALALLTEMEVNGDTLQKPGDYRRLSLEVRAHLALAATFGQNFAYADLVNSSFPAYHAKYRDSIVPELADEYWVNHILAKGFNLQKQGHYPEARAVYEKVLDQPKQTEPSDYTLTNIRIMRGNFANSLVEEGRYEEAEPMLRTLLEQALIDAEKSHELRTKAMSNYCYHLHALVGLERYDEVQTTLEEAVAFRQTIDTIQKGRKIGLVYTHAANAAAQQADFPRADSLFALARYAFLADPTPRGEASLPRIHKNPIYGQEEFLYFLASYRDAFLQRDAAGQPGALDNALATAATIDSLLYRGSSNLSLLGSAGTFLQLGNKHFAKAIDIALELHRRTGDEAYRHAAFGYAARQKSNLLRRYLNGPQLAQSFGVPQETIGWKIKLETDIMIAEKALAAAATEAEKTPLRNRILDLQRELTELRRGLENDFPAFARALRGAAAIDPVAACASLPDNKMVVEYFLSRDSIYAFTLSAAGMAHHVLPRPADLETTIDGTLGTPPNRARLYDLLVAPLVAGHDDITRLQFIPDGPLWRIPFGGLEVGGAPLIMRYAPSLAYSSALLFAPEGEPVASGDYFGLGLTYDYIVREVSGGNRSVTDRRLRDMGPLPFADDEVLRAHAALGGRYEVVDSLITRARFFEEIQNAGVFHFAMHGLLDEDNPMKSALVFRGEGADPYDLLYMQDILGRSIPAELTVLTACHSGNGPVETAEGMQSMGLAFTAAGSRATITSLWSAPDRPTSDIMGVAFEEMAAGKDKDVALQLAVQRYLAAGTTADREVEKWGHLVLIGSTEALARPGWSLWAIASSSVLAILVLALLWRQFQGAAAGAKNR